MGKNILAGVIGAVVIAAIFKLLGLLGDAALRIPIPANAVVAFNQSACPTGWSSFSIGYGRYIVGLRPGGKLAEGAGQSLADMEDRPTGQHEHTVTTFTATGEVYGKNSGGLVYNFNDTNAGYKRSTESRTTDKMISDGKEVSKGTNAPYVQLSLCQKDA